MQCSGISHRDIKPGNLFLVGDTVKIGDFGLSIQTVEVSSQEYSVVGTAQFLSPAL